MTWGAPEQPYPPGPGTPALSGSPGTWLGWSIAASILCCTPIGIVGIVFAALAMSARDRGDYAAAEVHLRRARLWTYISAGVALVAVVIGVAVAAIDAATNSA